MTCDSLKGDAVGKTVAEGFCGFHDDVLGVEDGVVGDVDGLEWLAGKCIVDGRSTYDKTVVVEDLSGLFRCCVGFDLVVHVVLEMGVSILHR